MKRMTEGKETWHRLVEGDGALSSTQKMIDKYGEENLGPYSDFEWGISNGKFSALRWVLGFDWDMLDT